MYPPEYLQEEQGRLKDQHPIKYQVFQLLPLHKQNQQVLIELTDGAFDSEEDAHLALATVIERSRFKKIKFTILPVIMS